MLRSSLSATTDLTAAKQDDGDSAIVALHRQFLSVTTEIEEFFARRERAEMEIKQRLPRPKSLYWVAGDEGFFFSFQIARRGLKFDGTQSIKPDDVQSLKASTAAPVRSLHKRRLEIIKIGSKYFHDYHTALHRAYRHLGSDDAGSVPAKLWDRAYEIGNQSADLVATSERGVKLKCKIAEWFALCLTLQAEVDSSEDTPSRILWSIVRDVLGGRDDSPSITPSPAALPCWDAALSGT